MKLDLKMLIINKTISKFVGYTTLVLVFFSMIFARSFIGIQYGNIQLGKLFILGAFAISLFFFVYSFLNYKYFYSELLSSRVHQLIIFLFLISLFLNKTSVFSSYTYKTSSYIWTISFLFLGKLVSDQSILSKKLILPFLLVLPLNYLFSTGRYPDIFMYFFNNYSDKFQFLKGSDILIVFLVSIILSYQFLNNDKLKLSYLFITTAVMIPLLLFLSRGAFLPAFIFFIIELIYWRKVIYQNFVFTAALTAICIPIFLASTLNVYGNLTFTKIEESIQTVEENIVVDNLTSLIKDKNTHKVFFSFYIVDGRLTSQDITTRWRLDIWQDVIEDMVDDEILLNGYGYNEIIPAMIDPNEPGRTGRDGKNENLHNYFVNIFARGGFLQLILFLTFFYLLINSLKKDVRFYRITSFILGALMTSSFDPSMEGVQFPLIFYFFLGYFVNQNINFSKNYLKTNRKS